MDRNRRIEYLKKIAQTVNVSPASTNLEGYNGVLGTIIPNIKRELLSTSDWIYMARIIGVIDQSLNALSNKTLNFYTVTTKTPSITSASYKNHDQLTALMRAAQMIKNKLSISRAPYTPAQKASEFTDPLRRDLATRLNITTMIGTIAGSPQDALRREITNWQAAMVK